MTLANGVRFIWLDQFIGQDGECTGFKRKFRAALEPTVAMPPDAIDSLIRSLNEDVAPFLFADTPDKAIQLIQNNQDKKIKFISSGSLGQPIIPFIHTTYPCVHSFYFFCAVIANHVEFALDYRSCLQIFTNEIDLLVRLARDISEDIIEQGRVYLNLSEQRDALKCFETARTLNRTANLVDTLNAPFLDQLRILDGHQGNMGLIRQAQEMLNPQQQQQSQVTVVVTQNEEQSPMLEENEQDQQLSQQAS